MATKEPQKNRSPIGSLVQADPGKARERIVRTIIAAEGSVRDAADALDVHEATLHKHITRLELRERIDELRQDFEIVAELAAPLARLLRLNTFVIIIPGDGWVEFLPRECKRIVASFPLSKEAVPALLRRLRQAVPEVVWARKDLAPGDFLRVALR